MCMCLHSGSSVSVASACVDSTNHGLKIFGKNWICTEHIQTFSCYLFSFVFGGSGCSFSFSFFLCMGSGSGDSAQG